MIICKMYYHYLYYPQFMIMIEDSNSKYTISWQWILRKDAYYIDKYTLYNVYTKTLLILSPALFSIMKILYYNAISMKHLENELLEIGIIFDYKKLNNIAINNNAQDLYIKSDNPYHNANILKYSQMNYKVPVTSTPVDVELHLTHNCNLACKHCFQSSGYKSDKNIHLSVNNWISIFKQFENLNMHNIIISGGEPLCYEHFYDLMSHVINYRLNFVIITNGMLINSSLLPLFKKKNIQLTISVDGHNAILHNLLRGEGSFERLDKILPLLVKNDINVNIAYTINKYNLPYIEDFINYILVKGLKSVSFGMIKPMGRALLNKDLLLSKVEEKRVYDLFNNLKSKYNKLLNLNFPDLSYQREVTHTKTNNYVCCSAGTRRIAIDSGGKLYPCIKAFGYKEFEIGDLKDKSIYDLWINNNKWNIFRGEICVSQINICHTCKFQYICSLKNCRLDHYSRSKSLYEKPDNCFLDKHIG